MSLRYYIFTSYIVLFSLTFLGPTLSSCSTQVEGTDIPEVIISESNERITQERFDSIFSFDRFIVPELTEHSILGIINKVIYNDGVMYILHGNNRITSFDSNGLFLRNYSHIGQGPGEYVTIDDFDIKDDILSILSQNKVYNYSLDNQFIKSISLPNAAMSIRILNSGIALNNGFGLGSKKTNDNFSYTYINKDVVENYIEFNKQMLGNKFTNQGLSSKFASAKDNDYVLTFFPYNDTIYNINVDNGSIKPMIAIKIGDRNINKDSSMDEIEAIKTSGAVNSIYAPYYWNNNLMFHYIHQNQPKLAIVKDNGEIILNGSVGADSNGLPISFIDLQSDSKSQQALSILSPATLNAIKSRDKDLTDFPILKQLSDNISEESNPIFIFYNIKI